MTNSTPAPVVCRVDASGEGIVSRAGIVLPVRVAERFGLVTAVSKALSPWRAPQAFYDPGRVLMQVAVAIAAGGDRPGRHPRPGPGRAGARPGPLGGDALASTSPPSRAMSTRSNALPGAATCEVREAVWEAAGRRATARAPHVVDLDATIIVAHSDKQDATPTWKKASGHHRLPAHLDHGPDGTGEPVAALLRPGTAGSHTAGDHVTVLRRALRRLPGIDPVRPGRKVLVRTVPRTREVPPGAGASHAFLEHLVRSRVQYSVGFTLTDELVALVDQLPAAAWCPAIDAGGDVRAGAALVELTDVADLPRRPAGMRLIVRTREPPPPGAQLRFTDASGRRLTAFVTNTARGTLQQPELRHRRRARREDCIHDAKTCRPEGLPLHSTAGNRIGIPASGLAQLLLAWTGLTALVGTTTR